MANTSKLAPEHTSNLDRLRTAAMFVLTSDAPRPSRSRDTGWESLGNRHKRRRPRSRAEAQNDWRDAKRAVILTQQQIASTLAPVVVPFGLPPCNSNATVLRDLSIHNYIRPRRSEDIRNRIRGASKPIALATTPMSRSHLLAHAPPQR